MLKHRFLFCKKQLSFQPPSGGCVLKLFGMGLRRVGHLQPPSGGCVLKLLVLIYILKLG